MSPNLMIRNPSMPRMNWTRDAVVGKFFELIWESGGLSNCSVYNVSVVLDPLSWLR